MKKKVNAGAKVFFSFKLLPTLVPFNEYDSAQIFLLAPATPVRPSCRRIKACASMQPLCIRKTGRDMALYSSWTWVGLRHGALMAARLDGDAALQGRGFRARRKPALPRYSADQCRGFTASAAHGPFTRIGREEGRFALVPTG